MRLLFGLFSVLRRAWFVGGRLELGTGTWRGGTDGGRKGKGEFDIGWSF